MPQSFGLFACLSLQTLCNELRLEHCYNALQNRRAATQQTMDLAVMFNNIGCKLFSIGKLDESLALFSGALRVVYIFREWGIQGLSSDSFLVDPSIQHALDIVHYYRLCSGSPLIGATASTVKQRYQPNSTLQDRTASGPTEEALLSIQNEPFTLETPYGVSSPSIHLAMTVLFFNNALLLYLVKGSSHRSVQRSLTLYSMATQALFENHALELIFASNRPVALLAIAILNNFGYVLHQVQEYDSSRLCFGTLHGVLCRLGPPLSGHERDLRLRFATNVFVFYHSGETPTAAAA